MRRGQIEWGEPKPFGFKGTVVNGRVGDLLVAQVIKRNTGGWMVNMYLAPLPDSLDRLSDTEKVSEQSAKASAQRVLNAFRKLLNGEQA